MSLDVIIHVWVHRCPQRPLRPPQKPGTAKPTQTNHAKQNPTRYASHTVTGMMAQHMATEQILGMDVGHDLFRKLANVLSRGPAVGRTECFAHLWGSGEGGDQRRGAGHNTRLGQFTTCCDSYCHAALRS